jgi:hypothetical protein
MGRSGTDKQVSNDPCAIWRNVPGFLYLNGDVVEEVRQLSGAGGKGTVDELGFQVLYDRIAQKLFPWCSTLTSRARYFFFSAAVLDLALREVIDDAQIDANADAGHVANLAEQNRTKLMRTIRRIERGLSLSLVTKHEASELGIFGSLKCRQWFRDNAEIGARGKILSSDSRYPNAIYRGSCRSLRLFAVDDSSTTGLLRARISGKPVLNANWQSQTRLVKAVLQTLDDFWADAQDRGARFAQAATALKKLPMFESFGGFEMTREEANFLYERIQESTNYLMHISRSQLRKLISDGDLDLESLKGAVDDTSDHELFDAGRYIDMVTTPFRALYQNYSSEPEIERLKRPDVREIQRAKDWLDATSKASRMEWAPVWRSEISPLIDEWIVALKGKDGLSRLVDALCERAEQIVAGRGQGKQAPHQRNAEESDLKRELDVRETSFRIGNGSMILRDIARGMAHR